MDALIIRKAKESDITSTYHIIRQCSELLSQQGMDNWKRYTLEKVEMSDANN